jgi:hypothetical protein
VDRAAIFRALHEVESSCVDDTPDFEALCKGRFGIDYDQLAVLRDESKEKSILWGRRRGKSYVCAMLLLRACYRYPYSDVWNPYVALTKVNARRFFWPVLKLVVARLGIPAKLNESELTLRIPGKSGILLGGCEDRAAIERWRGGKFGTVVNDECGAMPWLDEFDDALDPALADLNGDRVYAGTPGPICDGYWHDISTGKREGMPAFHTTMFTSPHLPNPEEYAARIRRKRGWDETNVTYRREYLAEWLQDLGVLVYPLTPEKNSVSDLPEPLDDRGWRFVIAVDPGYTEATGIVVLAVHDAHDPTYVIDAWKRSECIVQEVAMQIAAFRRKYPRSQVVMDSGGMGKVHAEETRRRLQIPVYPFEKRERKSAVRWMHDMVRSGQIKVLDVPATQDYRDECAVLQWDEHKQDHNKTQSNNKDGQKNDHLCDAAMGGNRHIRHYSHTPHEERPVPGTREYYQQQEDRILGEMEERLQGYEEEPFWDR